MMRRLDRMIFVSNRCLLSASMIEYGLQLDNNRLDGTIPTTFGNLASLGLLNLEDNLLTGTMPSEIGLLTVLCKSCFF